MQLRYLVGAGEVMFDILVIAAVDSESDRQVGGLIEKAIVDGDAIARVERDLLLQWTHKKQSGDTKSIGDRPMSDDDARLLIRAYRALILKFVGIADVNRLATLDQVLTAKTAQGNPLAATLKVMLDSSHQDLQTLVDQAVQREVEKIVGHAPQGASGSQPSPSTSAHPTGTPAKSGCYVATAVYGSYDCPEVWVLRRYRDQSLTGNWLGRVLIKTYYVLSPILVRLVGANRLFRKIVRLLLDLLVIRLGTAGYSDSPYVDAPTAR